LQAKGLVAGDLNILVREWPQRVHAKIRFRKKESPCSVVFENDRVRVSFEADQEAITPGQSAVFYG